MLKNKPIIQTKKTRLKFLVLFIIRSTRYPEMRNPIPIMNKAKMISNSNMLLIWFNKTYLSTVTSTIKISANNVKNKYRNALLEIFTSLIKVLINLALIDFFFIIQK